MGKVAELKEDVVETTLLYDLSEIVVLCCHPLLRAVSPDLSLLVPLPPCHLIDDLPCFSIPPVPMCSLDSLHLLHQLILLDPVNCTEEKLFRFIFSIPHLSTVGSRGMPSHAFSTLPRAATTYGCLDRRELLFLSSTGRHVLVASSLAAMKCLYSLPGSAPSSSC